MAKLIVSEFMRLALGSGKRLLPSGVLSTFALRSTTPYPNGVVGLHYARQRG